MNIASTQYTLNRKAFEIYVSGCHIHCKGCHNPELWDFNYGTPLMGDYLEGICEKISVHSNLIDQIWILGGEPLDQGRDLYYLVHALQHVFPNKKYVLFTGYDLKDVDLWCFMDFDEIKFGRYDESLRVEGEYLASSNQGIWKKGEDMRGYISDKWES